MDPLDFIHKHFIHQHHLQDKEKNCHAYIKICKGMYVLPQGGMLANKIFIKDLATYEHYKVPFTPGHGKTSPDQYNSHWL